jgi:hypothetical protein
MSCYKLKGQIVSRYYTIRNFSKAKKYNYRKLLCICSGETKLLVQDAVEICRLLTNSEYEAAELFTNIFFNLECTNFEHNSKKCNVLEQKEVGHVKA